MERERERGERRIKEKRECVYIDVRYVYCIYILFVRGGEVYRCIICIYWEKSVGEKSVAIFFIRASEGKVKG